VLPKLTSKKKGKKEKRKKGKKEKKEKRKKGKKEKKEKRKKGKKRILRDIAEEESSVTSGCLCTPSMSFPDSGMSAWFLSNFVTNPSYLFNISILKYITNIIK